MTIDFFNVPKKFGPVQPQPNNIPVQYPTTTIKEMKANFTEVHKPDRSIKSGNNYSECTKIFKNKIFQNLNMSDFVMELPTAEIVSLGYVKIFRLFL